MPGKQQRGGGFGAGSEEKRGSEGYALWGARVGKGVEEESVRGVCGWSRDEGRG